MMLHDGIQSGSMIVAFWYLIMIPIRDKFKDPDKSWRRSPIWWWPHHPWCYSGEIPRTTPTSASSRSLVLRLRRTLRRASSSWSSFQPSKRMQTMATHVFWQWIVFWAALAPLPFLFKSYSMLGISIMMISVALNDSELIWWMFSTIVPKNEMNLNDITVETNPRHLAVMRSVMGVRSLFGPPRRFNNWPPPGLGIWIVKTCLLSRRLVIDQVGEGWMFQHINWG